MGKIYLSKMKILSVLLVLALATMSLQQVMVHYHCEKSRNGNNFTIVPVRDTRRRLQVMVPEYCAKHTRLRRLQAMVPECDGIRRLRIGRRAQVMAKFFCPVIGEWQCHRNDSKQNC